MSSNSPSELAFDTRTLGRPAIWGGAAVAALCFAIVAGNSNSGARQPPAKPSTTSQESVQKSALAVQIAARSAEIEAQTRRLTEAVHHLTSERDRLVARIALLERNFEDLTGTVRRQAAPPSAKDTPAAEKHSAVAPAAASPPTSGPAVSPTQAAPPKVGPPGLTAAVVAPSRSSAVIPVPPANQAEATAVQPAGELPLPVVAKTDSEPPVTDLGVDLGGATSFDGLRVLWVSTKSHHVGLLDDLSPVVAVRESARSKSPELRLIAGPVENAEAAARICAKLSVTRRYCQPVAFAGERLARADTVPIPERKPAPPAPKQAQPAPQPQPQAPPPPASSPFPWLFR